MRSVFKKKLHKCIIVAAVCFLSLATTYSQVANFSGKWMINESKSDFGVVPYNVMFKGMKVEQTKDSILVFGQTYATSDFSNKSTGYPINGTTIKIQQSNGRIMTAFIEWSSDKKTVTRESSYSTDDPDVIAYRSIERWELSADGKTLTLTRSFDGINNNATVKAVYDKF